MSKKTIANAVLIGMALAALTACGGGGGTSPLPSTGAAANSVGGSTPAPTATPSTAPAPAQPVPTPAPGITQVHLLTADYLGRPDGTQAIAWTQAAPYLTWAQTGVLDANAIAATGIKTQFYIDAARTQTDDALYTSDESTFAHDCAGDRVTDQFAGTTQYVMNEADPTYQQLFSQRVQWAQSQGHFDAIFSDDAGPLSTYAQEHPFSPSLPCNYSDAAWLASGIALEQISPLPIIFNGLHEVDTNTHGLSPSLGLLGASNAVGGNFEECYGSASQPETSGWFWQDTEDTEIDVAAQQRIFECMVEDSSPAASSISERIYTLASFLLTYDPSTSVLWDFYQTPSGFHVEPESQLVALNPQIASVTDVQQLQQNGVYVRAYGSCYLAGASVGPCAVVVNPSSSSEPFPLTGYNHTLALSGGGILDGGTVSTSGPPPPATLGAMGAAIVFQ